MLGVLAVDLALLIPFSIMDSCGKSLTQGSTMLVVMLVIWKAQMLVYGVYLATKCRIVPVARYCLCTRACAESRGQRN